VKHEIIRVRHELHRRSLVVRRTEHVTPQMLRLTLGGDALAGFTSAAPDDHIKVIVRGGMGEDVRRDYTPRRFDPVANELIVDFALHDAGPVTQWARNAKPGDLAEVGGPRGSVVVRDDFDWWLLIGDETALPAIGRRIEGLSKGTHVTSLVAATSRAEEQTFATEADHRAIWVHRPADKAVDAAPLIDALKNFSAPPGDGYVWIAAEGGVARALRKHVVEEMHHRLEWLKASGYWVRGKADTTEKFEG
jgi:NADPH-dependent ferric siderophore reductase